MAEPQVPGSDRDIAGGLGRSERVDVEPACPQRLGEEAELAVLVGRRHEQRGSRPRWQGIEPRAERALERGTRREWLGQRF